VKKLKEKFTAKSHGPVVNAPSKMDLPQKDVECVDNLSQPIEIDF